MGSLFDFKDPNVKHTKLPLTDVEKESLPSKQPRPPTPKQGATEIFASGIVALILMISGYILAGIAWVGKKVLGQYFTSLGHLLDVRGLEKELARKNIATAIIILVICPGIPLFLLYKIPAVQDRLSLSENVTMNIETKTKSMPKLDRSLFVKEPERRLMTIIGTNSSLNYYTYAGYKAVEGLEVNKGECQLVTRSKVFVMASQSVPWGAKGFDDDVLYIANYSWKEITFWKFTRDVLMNPTTLYLWLVGNGTFTQENVSILHVESWARFQKDWHRLGKDDQGYGVYTIKAKAREHGMVCI